MKRKLDYSSGIQLGQLLVAGGGPSNSVLMNLSQLLGSWYKNSRSTVPTLYMLSGDEPFLYLHMKKRLDHLTMSNNLISDHAVMHWHREAQ